MAWYALGVLTVCYTFSYIDRQILAFLIGPLKQDLHITDTQIGLLQGIAFALFYTLFGLPMGALADRYSRRNIILIGLVVWSSMTALSSAARSYASLALARMGVGIGEAVINPCALSMISDYFPRERLSSALSFYMMGIQLGSGLALIIGGMVVQAVTNIPSVTLPLLGDIAPWRLTFIIVGLPGLLIALVLLTVREPARRQIQSTRKVSMSAGLRAMAPRLVPLFGISVTIGCEAMSNYALLSWGPEFFGRLHHWPRAQTGFALGLISVCSGCLGLFMGGRLADRWQGRGISDSPLRVNLIALTGVGLLVPTAMLVADPHLTIALLAVAVIFVGLPIGCGYAGVQFILPDEIRGLASGLVIFVVNLLGLGLGSLLPGLFNDRLFADELKVGDSIALTVAIASTVGFLSMLLTLRPYRRQYSLLHPA